MPATLIYEETPYAAVNATADGEDLWVSPGELTAATGWEWKPQGLCRAERCVPIPPNRVSAMVSADGRFNIAEFGRSIGQPVVHDDAAAVWLFGAAAATRGDALRSLDAPDFPFPDLEGKVHALTDFRGKKVLLLSWASW